MTSGGPDGSLRTLNVLYVHHSGAFGGASRSLLELIEGFPPASVTPRLLTQRGSVVEFFSTRGIEVIQTTGISQFDNTRFGRYRGKRWLLLLREAFYLPYTLGALLHARSRWKNIDLVHVNEIVAVPAIVLSRWIFRCPVVVHVRSVQDPRTSTLRSRWLARMLRRHADAVIAIDETVRRSLPHGIAAEVIHNAYSPRSTAVAPGSAGSLLPPRPPGILRVAMVGNLLPLKGVRQFLESALLCRDRSLGIEFVIVGGNTRDLSGMAGQVLKVTGFAHDMEREVKHFLAQHGLEETVRLVAFTPDIDRIYGNIDVLCFPSLLDAPGRPVIEAAWWKVPSIVAVEAPLPDTMIHQETGICVKAGDAAALADAIEYFSRNPGELQRMGQAAHRLALRNFDAPRNAQLMLETYRRLQWRAVSRRQPA